MKVLVMYYSVYGTTKQYAEWIAEELNGDIFDIKDVKSEIFTDYDVIISGSGVYGGDIKGISLFLKNQESLKDKKLVIFTCGIADPDKAENVDNVNKTIAQIVPEDMYRRIKVFCLRGGVSLKKLSFLHKTGMRVLWLILKIFGVERFGEHGKDFAEIYGKDVDFVEKKNIEPILEFCRMKKALH